MLYTAPWVCGCAGGASGPAEHAGGGDHPALLLLQQRGPQSGDREVAAHCTRLSVPHSVQVGEVEHGEDGGQRVPAGAGQRRHHQHRLPHPGLHRTASHLSHSQGLKRRSHTFCRSDTIRHDFAVFHKKRKATKIKKWYNENYLFVENYLWVSHKQKEIENNSVDLQQFNRKNKKISFYERFYFLIFIMFIIYYVLKHYLLV